MSDFVKATPGSAGRALWWPSGDPEACAFQATCPNCAKVWTILPYRVPDSTGKIVGGVPCACGAWVEPVILLGWNAATDQAPMPAQKFPVLREVRHDACGTVSLLSEEVARWLACDPRSYRGHICAHCKRNALNHELVFVGDGQQVGRGWYGHVRYTDLTDHAIDKMSENFPRPRIDRGR